MKVKNMYFLKTLCVIHFEKTTGYNFHVAFERNLQIQLPEIDIF